MTQPPAEPHAAADTLDGEPLGAGLLPGARRPGRHRILGQQPIQPEPRTAVVVVSGIATVLLLAIAWLLPVPFVILRPGPAINTLGRIGGKPVIAVSGHATYPTVGELDLTTVTLRGGPGSKLTLAEVLLGWLQRSDTVIPESDYYPPGQTQQDADEEGRAEMTSSQDSATAAALTLLHIPVEVTLTLHGTQPGTPAAGVLKAGDVLVRIQGQPITDVDQLRTTLDGVTPGDAVTLRVRRSGQEMDVAVRTIRGTDGQAMLGVYLDPSFHFPFSVKIQIENVVGPSAGMAFALGIVDLLTPGDLTGGKHIAGTGSIDADGTVGPIGGIRQKMVGAHQAGADYFLAPTDDCAEVPGHIPAGLHVYRVGTLAQARDAVAAIAAGRQSSLPTCG